MIALPEGFSSQTSVVKDIRMHHVQGGDGPPLVIVHGGWDSWWAWREVIPTLARRYTVILPALRGLGRTTKASDGYLADNLGDDLHQLMRHLGHERYSLVGHDFGAVACYAAAAQFRNSVERLAVFEMVMPGIGLPERAMTPQPGGRYLWHMGFHSVPDIPELLIQGHLREYMQWFFYDNSAVPEAVSRESLDHYVEIYSQPGALRAFLQYYRNLWTSGEQIRVHSEHKLTIPVMAYGGDASLGEYAEHGMRRLAANVTAGVTRNCGHWVAEEQPAFVRDRIMEFCASSPSSEES